MEYKVISGTKVEIIRSMRGGKGAARRGKKAKKSTAHALLANENQSQRELARTINCNFGKGDLWVKLGYDNAHLPADREQAKKSFKKWLDVLRKMAKAAGIDFRYITALGVKNSSTGAPARLHWHCLFPRELEELIEESWPSPNGVQISKLDGRGDYSKISTYIMRNTDTGIGGERRYSVSRGMAKPIVTEPVEVKMSDPVSIPEGAEITEQSTAFFPDTGWESGYLSYIKPERDFYNGRYKKIRFVPRR